MGMDSSAALNLLASEIAELRASCWEKKSWPVWVREAWHPASRLAVFPASSFFFCLMLFLAFAGVQTTESLVAAAVVLLTALLNVTISGLDSYLRTVEVYRRADRLVFELREKAEEKRWRVENYPHLHTPLSASIVLQWVLRDGKLVNLPWALLVKGDTVLLKPGQISPARCRLVSEDVLLKLEQGETFHMDAVRRLEKSLLPEFRQPIEPQKFVIEETPYLAELQQVLERAQHRPVSRLNKQRYFLTRILEHLLLPLLLTGVFSWNFFRFQYNWAWAPLEDVSTLFLEQPAAVAIPLLPLVFPVWWLVTNNAALASVLTHFKFSTMEVTADPFDDTLESPDVEEKGSDVSWPDIGKTFLSCLLGDGTHISRTENLLHTLGSLTTYCCTDKKGLLSWQNPSAEKIFFFKPNNQESHDMLNKTESTDVVSEILTVTHDHKNPFKVEFDDPCWRTHLSSLKPLGLSILLNTCNLWTEEKYTYFFQHLLCESAREPLQGDVEDTNTLDLLPIPARGCLCELSSRIGFPLGSENEYELKQQMQTFRSVISHSMGADSFTRHLALAKLKFPFPHMVSLVMESREDRTLQLLTQGTADIVLDSCVDAWVGQDLVTLTEEMRKKILEFYHRASLTSYCSAFSYRPISYIPPWPKNNHYLELPPNSSPFLSHYNHPNHHSVDRVSIGPDADSAENDKEFEQDSQDVYSCLEAQCSQTFLGMVQMQYQARVDVVQFIDLLEKACIRFVHFSKENELRSRVFSEKMGLESGWNCHISLRSDADMELNSRRMYDRRWLTKKFSSENSNVKHFLSASLPDRLSRAAPRQLLDWQLRESGLDTASRSASSDSMLQYDMSNRAQLPCGIENIRPHLDTMDNVPLLVSLFTDSSPGSTREMVRIMQENGEVVVVLGSSANYHNMQTFLTADASLSVEPLYPQVCQHVPVYSEPEYGLSPTHLAARLVSVASSVHFRRDDQVSIYSCIMWSRRYVLALRHALQFWTATCLFLSLILLVCVVLCLPSPLSAPQQLFLNMVHLPLTAIALFFSASDRNIRNISTGKNGNVVATHAMVWYGTWCYALRFLIPLLSLLAAHTLALHQIIANCGSQGANTTVRANNSSSSINDGGDIAGLSDDTKADLCRSQVSTLTDVNMTFLTAHILLVSLSFVSRTDHLWNLRPRRSWPLLMAGSVILVLQSLYLLVSLSLSGAAAIPALSWIIYSCAMPVICLTNELIKRQEIKVNVRFQKRARLEFGTKLGINSPF